MELDELKSAWHALGDRLERQDAIQLQLLRDSRLDRARRSLRPLMLGQTLQFLLGVALILLGVACWTRNPDVPGLLAAGILVHAFGVANAALAGITMALIAAVDYSAPVLRIQKQLATLRRFHVFNANVSALPWWIMWLPVVVAFAGLGDVPPGSATPAWVWASLGIGLAGLAGTWLYAWSGWRGARRADGGRADGADGIRRSERIVDELARFGRD
ncbi:serine/threonine protein kinase [Luteimonas sp. RD2P54]|uniref:Serine/threonine protein kinase n=1 Tax=Luteimonas endophytica TaxID=3042023 RepID=A0ABT6JCA2_9GAMM|nr:serine/threonine protein kinase [Luteimonas endophytica]MDH5824456.1 serine/threonine protein kinase [Luteimonas endophytica]